MATSIAYIYGKEFDVRNQASALETASVSYIVSKCHGHWSTDGLIGP